MPVLSTGSDKVME